MLNWPCIEVALLFKSNLRRFSLTTFIELDRLQDRYRLTVWQKDFEGDIYNFSRKEGRFLRSTQHYLSTLSVPVTTKDIIIKKYSWLNNRLV